MGWERSAGVRGSTFKMAHLVFGQSVLAVGWKLSGDYELEISVLCGVLFMRFFDFLMAWWLHFKSKCLKGRKWPLLISVWGPEAVTVPCLPKSPIKLSQSPDTVLRFKGRKHRHLSVGGVLKNFRTMFYNYFAVNIITHNTSVIQILLEKTVEITAKTENIYMPQHFLNE